MVKNEEAIKEYLISHNPDFRRLAEEHHSYELQLNALNGRPHVTDQEQVEETNLKKLKLHLKDEMNRMIQEYRQGPLSHPHP